MSISLNVLDTYNCPFRLEYDDTVKIFDFRLYDGDEVHIIFCVKMHLSDPFFLVTSVTANTVDSPKDRLTYYVL